MTNEKAIEIMQNFIANLEACDIPIYAEEREAIEKLIRTAENFDTLLGVIGFTKEG